MKKLLVYIAVLLYSYATLAQHEDRILLSELLNSIESEKGIVFSYNPELISEIKVTDIADQELAQVLENLTTHSAFIFEQVDEKNVTISPKVSGRNVLIKGTLKDADRDPLVGATIRHQAQNITISTNENGVFNFLTTYGENDSLSFHFIGFKTHQIALSDFNEKGTIPITLSENELLLSEVTVKAYLTSGILYNHSDQSIEIKTANAGLLPGETETDIFTSLNALPGINSANGKAGDLTIRGSDPDKTLITFDNIPIYHKGHYFGTFSPFNAQIVDNVKIQRNGSYGAERGGRVGGLVEISSKDKLSDSATYQVGMATSFYTANAEIPLIKNKVGLIVGARSSYPFDYTSPKINAINNMIYQETEVGAAIIEKEFATLNNYDFNFYDANAKIIYQLNDKHKLNLSALKIKNHMDVGILSNIDLNREILQLDTANLNNWGVNAEMQSQWSDKLSSTTSLTQSSYHQLFAGINEVDNRIVKDESFLNRTTDTKAKTEATYLLKNKNNVKFGYVMDYHDLISASYYLRLPPPPAPPNPPVETNHPESEFTHSVFASYNVSGYEKLINLSLGVRTSYYTGTDKFYVEPRVIMNAFVTDNITLKANAGIYNQFINQLSGSHVSSISGLGNLNWRLSNDTDIPVVNSKQVMTGAIFFKNNFVLDIEGYYKVTDHVTAYNFIDRNSDNIFLYGGYETYGADVLVKKTYKKIEGSISYSYSECEAHFDTLTFEYVWNQRHILNAVLGYRIKNLKLSTGWSYKSGLAALDKIRRPFLNNRGPENIVGQGGNGPVTFVEGSAEKYTDYFPNTHQLDISASYLIVPQKKNWNMSLGVSVLNAYDQQNIYEQVVRRLPSPPNAPNSALLMNMYSLRRTVSAMIKVTW